LEDFNHEVLILYIVPGEEGIVNLNIFFCLVRIFLWKVEEFLEVEDKRLEKEV
jgi:hypothetical protein